jgi:hypothetical protein
LNIMANAGQVLCGRYRILNALGAGGMAAVWQGEQVSTGLPVAIKIILRELLDTPGAIARFQSEAKAVAQLRSQHVVRLIDYDVDLDAGPFIVMELLEGQTLGARLEHAERLSPPEFSRIFAHVAKGLDHAHANRIVHRDIKPDNIFLVRDDDGACLAKLLDFGVAKDPLGTTSGLTSPGLLVGTISYMSPEQALGKPVDFRTDLWALGVIAYECLVGRIPFGADTDSLARALLDICTLPVPIPSELKPDIAPAFDAWFAKACAREPDDRFTSAGEMAAALDPICASHERRSRAKPVEAGYYVIEKDLTVGPVAGAILKRGMLAGRIPGSALVWRKGWPEWRFASTLGDELAGVEPAPAETLGPAPGLEAVGARSLPPSKAPTTLRTGLALPDQGTREAIVESGGYYVTTGDTTVGPVSRHLLLRGVEAGRVPETALVWREGWKHWRSARLVRAWLVDGALLSIPPGHSPVVLYDRPGLEAIGMRSIPPPMAPPSEVQADDCAPDAPVFHVSDGETNVGPISGTLLCRGVVAKRVPDTAMVWRKGWDEWRNVADVVWELAGLRMDRSGRRSAQVSIRVLGSPSLPPPGAPSTVRSAPAG